MNILTPSRITSLGSQSIRIVPHGTDKLEPWSIKVYPFETIFSIKQRIALHFGERTWMPSQQWIAVEDGTAWRPIEFRWPFSTTLEDPLKKGVKGQIDSRIMERDVRKPVFPTVFSGITLENANLKGDITIHVWNLASLAEGLDITNTIFGGYIQLYFPGIDSTGDVLNNIRNAPLTDIEKKDLEVLTEYRKRTDDRLSRMDQFLKEMTGQGSTLSKLRALRILLPKKTVKENLEIMFYEMKPTATMPIIRYFSSQIRTPPVLKLATGPAGIPLITDTKLLHVLLSEQPSTESGSVILIKIPIQAPRAPFGIAWSLKIYEDGGAELSIGALRLDEPIPSSVIKEALRILPSFLQNTPWHDTPIQDFQLTEFTGSYEYTIQRDVSKPSITELRKRIDTFLPVFQEEKIAGTSDIVSLRWKAISNMTAYSDPVLNYITNLFIKTGTASMSELPIQEYVGALSREFGLGPTEGAAAIESWISKRAEYVLTDPDSPEKAVPKYALGIGVFIQNVHPKYIFQISNVESETDLRRILSLLEVWVSHSTVELSPAITIEKEVIPTPIQETKTVDEAQLEEMYAFLGNFGEPIEEEDEEGGPTNIRDVDQKPTEVMEIQKEMGQLLPKPLEKDEQPLQPIGDEYFINQLKRHDEELFGYKSDNNKRYSQSCQKNVARQPHVMSPETYQRIRSLYGNSVHWLEAPLSKEDTIAVKAAYTSVKERDKFSKNRDELIRLEKRALELGVPLKDNESIMKTPDAEMKRLMEEQASMSLWIVVRTGTKMDAPNYYICVEYWCVRDDLPITESDFADTVSRFTGKSKPANSCPFCYGTIIRDESNPGKHETVLRRGTSKKGTDQVAKYAGFMSTVHHPDKFALPCCFTSPNKLIPPDGVLPIPPPKVELPDLQKQSEQKEIIGDEKEEEIVKGVTKSMVEVFDDVKMKMDYSIEKFRFLTDDKKAATEGRYKLLEKGTKIEINAKKILRSYILEARHFPLDVGKVGILLPEIDAFIGQDRKQYIENPKHGMTTTHPQVNARGFFRLGTGIKTNEIGKIIPTLIGYSQFIVGDSIPEANPAMKSSEDVLDELFGIRETLAFHAFQQANYGSLLREFSLDNMHREIKEGEFQEWCTKMGLPLPQQRAYATQAYRAWKNFKDYAYNITEYKEFRIWESLFATPGLFTTTGVLLARITMEKDGAVTLHCPSFGVSLRSQQLTPPIMLLYEDTTLGLTEPLILFDGPDKLHGAIYPTSSSFGYLHKSLREPLRAFYSQYIHPIQGCGRPAPLVHPWMPESDSSFVPRLGSVYERLSNYGLKADALIRDRTFRLVGIRCSSVLGPIFLPTIDDGTILIDLPSLYDIESIPYPTIQSLLTVLYGTTGKGKKLVDEFIGYQPVELRAIKNAWIGIITRSGCLIPVKSQLMSSTVTHPIFAQLEKRGTLVIDSMPWEEDIHMLIPQDLSDKNRDIISVMERNPEEILEESYQHVRLTLSNWLLSKSGESVKKQIELLRSAKNRLPLYELRKRGDILLYPLIESWIRVGPLKDITPSLLRRDCVQIQKKDDCQGMCAWSNGRCRIHASATPRFIDPIYVITARIVDELLRTYGDAKQILDGHVSRLRIPQGIVQGDKEVLFALEDDDEIIFEQLGLKDRLPSRFTRGLVYPEELSAENIGFDETHQGIPITWEGIHLPTFHPDIARDPKTKLQIFWSMLTEVPYSKLQSAIESANYTKLADMLEAHILTTRFSEISGLELDTWYAPTSEKKKSERMFVILDAEGIGLQINKSYLISEMNLPLPIRRWLDIHSPVQT